MDLIYSTILLGEDGRDSDRYGWIYGETQAETIERVQDMARDHLYSDARCTTAQVTLKDADADGNVYAIAIVTAIRSGDEPVVITSVL